MVGLIGMAVVSGMLLLILVAKNLFHRRRPQHQLHTTGDTTSDDQICGPYARHYGPPFEEDFLFFCGDPPTAGDTSIENLLALLGNEGVDS